ncbi:glycosyltransferase family 4 protein [Bacteroidota bacterium]
MEKLSILQLVPRFPFPLDDGGKIGIANIYREFAEQGAEITLFSLGDEKISDEALNEAKKYGDVILFNHNTDNTFRRILKSILFNNSIYLNKHISAGIKKRLKEVLNIKKIDVVHADHSCMAPLALFIKSIQNIPVGLRLHNIEWLIWKRYADSLSPLSPKRLYINQQANLLKNAESEIYNNMDVCFAITEPDRQRALELSPNANVVVASAGVNPEEWQPDDSVSRNPHELILATTYHWRHNVNALKWFIKDVLPLIKKEIPGIKLTLIGKETPDWLNQYPDTGLNVVGYVDKVQPYYNKAAINIAPLFVGGGIRIKILEAMAMELPVVASAVAAEGINAKPGNGLFFADTKEIFAKSIIELCNNPAKARKTGQAAREYVLKEYSWKQNVGIMLREYKKLI